MKSQSMIRIYERDSHCHQVTLLFDSYVLITHASYEDRSCAICEERFPENKIVGAVVIYSNENMDKKKYQINLEKQKIFFRSLTGCTPLTVGCDRNRPVNFIELFAIEFEKLPDGIGYLIDISTFPRDRLICVLNFLRNVCPQNKVIEFIYTSPRSYSTEKKDGWLSRGVRRVRAVPGFNGRQSTRKKSLLVMLLGHEGERAHITLKSVEPDDLIVIIQDEDQISDSARITSQKGNSSILMDYTLLEKEIAASYNDPLSTYVELKRIHAKYSATYNIFVSVNGTKLQILGVTLACMALKDIQIIYAYPQTYNQDDYSNSTGRKYYGSIELPSSV